jgi:hypothetical protein
MTREFFENLYVSKTVADIKERFGKYENTLRTTVALKDLIWMTIHITYCAEAVNSYKTCIREMLDFDCICEYYYYDHIAYTNYLKEVFRDMCKDKGIRVNQKNFLNFVQMRMDEICAHELPRQVIEDIKQQLAMRDYTAQTERNIKMKKEILK